MVREVSASQMKASFNGTTAFTAGKTYRAIRSQVYDCFEPESCSDTRLCSEVCRGCFPLITLPSVVKSLAPEKARCAIRVKRHVGGGNPKNSRRRAIEPRCAAAPGKGSSRSSIHEEYQSFENEIRTMYSPQRVIEMIQTGKSFLLEP